jgi:ABC-type glutathione transport system ATPase component
MDDSLLCIEGLQVTLDTTSATVATVDGVELAVPQGRALGIVGESGCDKSMLSLAIMGLVPKAGQVVAGTVMLEGRDLVALSPATMRRVCGGNVARIFQDPLTSHDPVHSVGQQFIKAMQAEVMEVLRRVPSNWPCRPQVLKLLWDPQSRFGLSYLFIAHELAVVKHVAHRVAVLYLNTPAGTWRSRIA